MFWHTISVDQRSGVVLKIWTMRTWATGAKHTVDGNRNRPHTCWLNLAHESEWGEHENTSCEEEQVLSLKVLRRDEISCGVYCHIYLSVRLVYAGNDVTRPCAGGLMVWGAEKLRSSGLRAGGSNPARCFFFPPFSFLFFFFVSNPEPFLFSVFLFGLK